jgi:hypothetical protein
MIRIAAGDDARGRPSRALSVRAFARYATEVRRPEHIKGLTTISPRVQT